MRPLLRSISLGLLRDLVNCFVVFMKKIRIFSYFIGIARMRDIASRAARFQPSRAFFKEMQLGTFERVFVLFGAVLMNRFQ